MATNTLAPPAARAHDRYTFRPTCPVSRSLNSSVIRGVAEEGLDGPPCSIGGSIALRMDDLILLWGGAPGQSLSPSSSSSLRLTKLALSSNSFRGESILDTSGSSMTSNAESELAESVLARAFSKDTPSSSSVSSSSSSSSSTSSSPSDSASASVEASPYVPPPVSAMTLRNDEKTEFLSELSSPYVPCSVTAPSLNTTILSTNGLERYWRALVTNTTAAFLSTALATRSSSSAPPLS
mmetsp:Transcript_38462/g.115332  ORF Transcript_38462/g.115332 Transcript_38462/m.115332 type:complete len:238 (-) Transcript_38462:2810-3523(-)